MTALDVVRNLAEADYKYGFVSDIESDFAPKGLDESTVRFISVAAVRAAS